MIDAWPPLEGLERGVSIGAGPRGTVFRAARSDGSGDVAVLVVHEHLAQRRELMAQLVREVKLARRIEHPCVAQVHRAEEVDGRWCVVMELAGGLTLRQYLEARGPVSVTEALDITKSIAAGLAAMHALGLSHRNLTPENVKLQQGRVKILDAGTAPQHELDPSGVTAYIAPERAAGRRATAQADLYSLGTVLFELLTGVPPFRADTPLAVLDLHRRASVPPLASHRDDVPPVVEQLMLHLLAKDPDDRPPSADEVRARIEDIKATERALGGAAPVPASDRFRAGPRRGREASGGAVSRRQLLLAVSATALGGAAVAAGAAAIGVLVGRRQPVVQVERLLPQEVVKVVTVDRVVTRDVVREVPVERTIIREVVPQSPAETPATPTVSPTAPPQATPEAAAATPTPVPAGVTVADAGARFPLDRESQALPGVLEPIRADNLARLAQLHRVGLGKAQAVAALLDGEIAVGSSIGLISVFDGESGREVRRWSTGTDDAPGSAVTALAARDDVLISGHSDGTLSAWDASTGMRRWSTQLDSEVTDLAIDDSGAAVAATGAAGTVGVWQGSDGAAFQQLAPEAAAARAVAFHPTRPLLAAGGDDGTIAMWDVRQGTVEAAFGDATRPIRALAFNAAGTLLAAAEAGGSVGIWDLASQTRQTTLSGLRFDADDVVFGPDGRWIAAADGTERVLVWDAVTGGVLLDMQDRAGAVSRGSLAVTADGASLACAVRHLAVALWSLPDGRLRRRLGAYGDATRVALRDDATLLASSHPAGTIELVGLPSGLAAGSIAYHTGLAHALAFSPDGSRLVSGGSADGPPLRMWDTSSAAADDSFAPEALPQATIGAAAFSPDGGLLATGWSDGVVRVWHTATWSLVTSLSAHTTLVDALQFGPTGDRLVTSDIDGLVNLWDLPSLTPVELPSNGVPVRAVAIHANGGPIAGALDDGAVILWDGVEGASIRRLDSPESGTLAVAFSPVAALLVSGHRSGTLRWWDTASGEPLHVHEGHGAPIVNIQLSAAGDLAASAAFDGTARLWGVAAAPG